MTPEKLCELAREAMTHAYVPYSGYQVGAALLKLELVAGENSPYGLYVKTVHGVTADDKAKQYWAFYVDGKYAEKGVDATEIVAGATYALKLESYS